MLSAKEEGERTVLLTALHLVAPGPVGRLQFVVVIAAEQLLRRSPQHTQEPLVTLFFHTAKSSTETE